jgi:hypothetical protein
MLEALTLELKFAISGVDYKKKFAPERSIKSTASQACKFVCSSNSYAFRLTLTELH